MRHARPAAGTVNAAGPCQGGALTATGLGQDTRMPVDAAWLTCPAYVLRDDQAAAAALAAAQAVSPLPVHPSPLLAERCPPGAWPAAERRRADFTTALNHRLIFAARGGYGCLDLAELAAAHRGPWPRLVGYSDLTVLHAAWWQAGRRDGVYGFLAGVAHGERARSSAAALLRGQPVACTLPPHAALRPGQVDAPCFPACLRVLAGLCGTPLQPDLRGAVLAIEDIDEKPYAIDRDLRQLHASGALAGVVALVGGRFPWTPAPGYAGPQAPAIITAWADRLGIPAWTGIPFGHDDDPLALPVGGRIRLADDRLDAWP